MKKRIFSLVVTLVLAVSLVIGAAVFASADEDGLKNTALNLAENVTIKMDVAIATPEDGAYAKITLPDGTVDKAQLVANAPKTADGNYTFTAAVAVQDLAADVKIEICKADGTTLVAEAATSALAYCEKYMTENPQGEFVPLINALKAYADAAKLYFDEEKNAESANQTDLSAIADMATAGTLPAGLTHRSATLLLESETVIRHYFELEAGKNIADYTFFVDLDKDGEMDAAEKLEASSKTDDNGTYYYVDIEGITPNELDEAYVLVAKDAENTYSCTYGALTYLKRVNSQNAANDTKNLVTALYNYSVEAGKLTGTITYVTAGSAVDAQVYEYGITTPIVAVSTKTDNDFMGWYDEDGNRVTVLTPAQTGDITLTAKFAPIFSKVLYDASEKTSGTRFYCANHIDPDAKCDVCAKATGECIADHTFADEGADAACDVCGAAEGSCIATHEFKDLVGNDGKCDNCQACVGNADCSVVTNAADACATCGKVGAASAEGNLGGIGTSADDKGIGYAEKITLENGKEVMLFGKTGTLYGAFGDNFAKTVGAEGSSMVYAFSVEIGRVDETIYGQYEIAPSIDFGTSFPLFYFRTFAYEGADTKAQRTTYEPLFGITPDGYAGIKRTGTDGYQITALNTVETVTFVFDFSDPANKAGDNVDDTAKIYVVNEAGEIVYSVEKAFNNDITEFVYASGNQLRFMNTGRLLLGDMYQQMYNNYAIAADGSYIFEYNFGEETALPTPAARGGFEFGGWYADEALTQPIDAISADAAGKVVIYPKWINTSTITYVTDG